MPTTKSKQAAYALKIALNGIKPAIWRRFCVPGEISLDRLHDVIQIVMGWQDSHLHEFEIAGQCYTEAPETADTDGLEGAEFRLTDLVARVGAKFRYTYDFGDDWEHTLTLERITPVPENHQACIACMAGKRNCPPEDVGGTDGYQEFLASLSNPRHEEHERMLKWVGGSFDPDAFDVNLVNLELAKYARWSRPRALNQELNAR